MSTIYTDRYSFCGVDAFEICASARVKDVMASLLCKLPLTVSLPHMRVSLAWTVLQGVPGMQESQGNTGIAEFCERRETAGSGGTYQDSSVSSGAEEFS